jgi:CheY-like chemotaxis protein
VLVVDDEPFMCKAAVAMLKALGHDVEAVSSGAEAVARVSSEPGRFACALVDFSMTPMDGVTCFRALRAEGVAAVIQKPLTLSLLRDSMDRVMPHD